MHDEQTPETPVVAASDPSVPANPAAPEDGAAGVVGATRTVTHALSEADLALFALVMGQAELGPEARLEAEPADQAEPDEQRVAPPALLLALLTTAAAQHSARPALARVLSGQARFIESAYAEETVRASATVVGVDEATGALRVRAVCETETGRRLAEADYLVRAD